MLPITESNEEIEQKENSFITDSIEFPNNYFR